MVGELSPALGGQFPAQAVKPIPCRKVGGCLMAPLQLTPPIAPKQAGHSSLLHGIGAGRKRKMEEKHGAEGNEAEQTKRTGDG